MPWWGWLIAGCVGAVLLTYVIVWVVVLRTVRAAMIEDEHAERLAARDRRRRLLGEGRWENR